MNFFVNLFIAALSNNQRPADYEVYRGAPSGRFQGFWSLSVWCIAYVCPICSVASIHSFRCVGHGVGQADTSASKKPRMGFAVIFRLAVSLS